MYLRNLGLRFIILIDGDNIKMAKWIIMNNNGEIIIF